MKYKYSQARQVWSESLPFGILFVVWGLMNLWLYLKVDSVEVISRQVASIWQCNILVFIASGLAGVVYLTVKVKRQAAKLQEVLEAMPCAVFVCDEEKKVECCNSKAQELLDNGVLKGTDDLQNWKIVDTEMHGIHFPGIYTYGNYHLAFKEHAFPTKRKQFAGNALVLLDISEWRKTTQGTKELVDIFQDLNQYLMQASSAFNESMEALANSTIKQALAFQELADYVYRAANDVELDAIEIKNTMDKISGNIDNRTEEHQNNLRKLNESVQLMNKSHDAAKRAAKQFELLQRKHSE